MPALLLNMIIAHSLIIVRINIVNITKLQLFLALNTTRCSSLNYLLYKRHADYYF